VDETYNTPYDDVFRTVLNDCSSLIIPVINEVFGENYSGNEAVVFQPNELFMERQDGKENKIITDSHFFIIGLAVKKKYHLECQSSSDNSMLFRIFEYDSQIALNEGEIKEEVLEVQFPHSAVIYLRHTANTPDAMKVRIITPGGQTEYGIPVMKTQTYSIEEIFRKKLLFLIPFYIFSHEANLSEYDKDKEKLKELQKEYKTIREKLQELCDSNEIDEYTKRTLIEMSNKVVQSIAAKYENVQKGVKEVMGGKILEYEAKTLRNEGIVLGREKGRAQGKYEAVTSLIELGYAPSAACDMLRVVMEDYEKYRQENQCEN
jgi:hypothetical protein